MTISMLYRSFRSWLMNWGLSLAKIILRVPDILVYCIARLGNGWMIIIWVPDTCSDTWSRNRILKPQVSYSSIYCHVNILQCLLLIILDEKDTRHWHAHVMMDIACSSNPYMKAAAGRDGITELMMDNDHQFQWCLHGLWVGYIIIIGRDASATDVLPHEADDA